MTCQFRLVSKVLSGDKRQPTDKQINAAEIRRTAKFHECPKCGTTWPLDEADECEFCEEG